MSETLVKPANQEDIEFSRDANENTIKGQEYFIYEYKNNVIKLTVLNDVHKSFI